MTDASFSPADSGTIPRLVQRAAQHFSAGIAVEDEGRVLSFTELGEEAIRSTQAFIAAGVEPGDRVGIWAQNCLEWVLAAIGLQSAGAVLVPLNTRFKGSEAGYILNKSRARLVFTVEEFLDTGYVAMLEAQELPHIESIITLKGDTPNTRTWQDFLAGGDAVDRQRALDRLEGVAPDDLSDILFTSGTTGKPKGVMSTHQQVLRGFEVWTEVVGLREGDRYLIVNPFFHAFGYKAGWLSCIMRGATMLPHPVFDVPEVMRRVSADRVSMLPGPPALLQSLLKHPERGDYDLSNLRLSVTGAAAIPVELIRRMHDDLGFETVITGYGLTESCGIATMCRDGDDAETIATTSGRAIPDTEVLCVDPEGNEVPRGESGEVVIRGYNVMLGYFEDEQQTRETIDSDGWLHTGDIGVMDERGYLRITDRMKDMFIMGGFNCYPAEIEGLLFEHPQVAQVAVIGIPDERMGEVGMAFVVAEPGTQPTPEEIVAWSREHMANYKVPRRVEVVDDLPLNASGKVQKFVLREKALAPS